jgi:hypothetical protein
LAQLLNWWLKTQTMSKENTYKAILAQAKGFMEKGNVSDYIQTLFKAHQLRAAKQAI